MQHSSSRDQADGSDRSSRPQAGSDHDSDGRSTPSGSQSSGTPVGVRVSGRFSESDYTTMVRVPGSLGDPGYHRESLAGERPKPVKFVDDVVSGALGEGISPPMLLKMEGCDGRLGLGEFEVDIKEEVTPLEAPPGADYGTTYCSAGRYTDGAGSDYGASRHSPRKDHGSDHDPNEQMHIMDIKEKIKEEKAEVGYDRSGKPAGSGPSRDLAPLPLKKPDWQELDYPT